MKSIFTIFLLLIYSGGAFGIVVNDHYCDGHLTNTTLLNFKGQNGCSCNTAKIPGGCCKDKIICLKGDAHQTPGFSFIAFPGSYEVHIRALHNTTLLHSIYFAGAATTPYFIKQQYRQPHSSCFTRFLEFDTLTGNIY
ncbi:MAG: hypothetical protein ABI921_09705 [Panacibacter sp.]